LRASLTQPERFLNVTVVENGSPVADAFVVADVGGAPFTTKKTVTGVGRFPLLNRDKLSHPTAWTNDFKIGGYSFNRG